MSKNFKSNLLKSMGDGVSCVTSYCPNGSRITTYCKQVEQTFNNTQLKQTVATPDQESSVAIKLPTRMKVA